MRAVAYEYFAGTKAVYRFDKNGIWISVMGDWQGIPKSGEAGLMKIDQIYELDYKYEILNK